MPRLHLLFGIFLLSVGTPVGIADVYKWVDEQGNPQFGDTPPVDVDSERMELQVREPDPADEGELRRRKLLEQADRDAAARLQQRQQERHEQARLREQRASQNARCMDLRRQLDVLQEQAPVYRDEEGRLRVKWLGDPYQGRREYLDGDARASEINRVRQDLGAGCADPDNPEKQRAARQQQVFSERCEAAQVELEALERPSARSTDSDLEQKRNEVRLYCGE